MKKTVLFVGGPADGKVVHGVDRSYFVWWVENTEVTYSIHKFLWSTKHYFVAAIDPNDLLTSKIIHAIKESNIEGYEY